MNEDQANVPGEGATEDLRAMLSSAFDAAPDDGAAQPAEPSEPNAGEQPAGPDRDEAGRFKAKEQTEQAPAAAAAPENTDQAQPQAPEPATPAIEAPASWSTAAKAAWANLPPAIQQEVLKREQDFAKGIESKSLEAKRYEPVAKVLESHADVFQKYGVQPQEGIAQLLQVQRMMDRDPAGTIKQLAQMYGVQLGGEQQPGQEAPPIDPQLAAVLEKVTGLERVITTQQQAAVEAQRQAAARDIEAFAKDHPHFDAVKPLMGRLIQSGAAEDLQTAYDMAVHADPTIRARIQEDQRRADEEKRQAEAREREKQAHAEKSRQAASLSPTGAPGNAIVPDTAPAKNLREEIERQFASRL